MDQIECVILKQIGQALRERWPTKRCYYHYNKNAVIVGPVLYINWSSDYNDRTSEIKAVIHNGFIYLIDDVLPLRGEPKSVIDKFDLADPNFSVARLAIAIRKYYIKPERTSNPWRFSQNKPKRRS